MAGKPRILCLDDESHVLDALRRQLRSEYNVLTTTHPQEALDLLAADRDGSVAVILSDLRMPRMTGVKVLERAREISPDTTRVLLTGDADLDGALAAINQGNVFRFMLKPCPPRHLRATMAAAVAQHRLIRAERDLLEATFKGSIDALRDALEMAQPVLVSRVARLQRLVERLCQKLGVADALQIVMAAQMGEIGAIALPSSATSVLAGGTPSSDAEAELLASLPHRADSVLARIPRLESVREIVRHQLPTDRNPMSPLRPDAPEGARLLQAVREYDSLIWREMSPDQAIATLSSRKIHDPDLLRALAEIDGLRLPNEAVREVGVDELVTGDELANDVYGADGMLLVARGQVITDGLLVKLRSCAATTGLQGHILVIQVVGS
ncbi:response regulator [Planosporangium flavigriseum]|uniref:Response regulator receiver modulated metal-depenent phosphohydrolase n=1 Tax=Planosporangium flavigriseum TaxID=373681 RepID=A0A8J3LN15_9ACTN|nr:response regulator [Planosporangium flavigriseum]NJC66916.1 response regulator [Planosporangium flavigriseum]GIG74339.1 response regulator receiver modulated metal-depenent phosphohydrolase [Planosporangium flavigriseum]